MIEILRMVFDMPRYEVESDLTVVAVSIGYVGFIVFLIDVIFLR